MTNQVDSQPCEHNTKTHYSKLGESVDVWKCDDCGIIGVRVIE